MRDEAGNVTTLSPHNFSLIGEPSEPLAWSYYSENEHGAINVDMLKALRVVEAISGEQLVHLQDARDSEDASVVDRDASLQAQVEALRRENRELRSKLARIEAMLGIE